MRFFMVAFPGFPKISFGQIPGFFSFEQNPIYTIFEKRILNSMSMTENLYKFATHIPIISPTIRAMCSFFKYCFSLLANVVGYGEKEPLTAEEIYAKEYKEQVTEFEKSLQLSHEKEWKELRSQLDELIHDLTKEPRYSSTFFSIHSLLYSEVINLNIVQQTNEKRGDLLKKIESSSNEKKGEIKKKIGEEFNALNIDKFIKTINESLDGLFEFKLFF
ncbi:MAG: hypothetical protein L0207_03340 [Chlamydiae bacterium]|nr:hypothetical protein [Chlamydiota bacterium]